MVLHNNVIGKGNKEEMGQELQEAQEVQEQEQLHNITLCYDLVCTLYSAKMGYQIESKGQQRQDCNIYE